MRERLRNMQFLNQTKAAHKNKIHSILIKLNIKCPYRDIFCKGGRKFLKELEIAKEYKLTITRNLESAEKIESYILEDIDFCKGLIETDLLTCLLHSINGIGIQFAPLIRYETGDINRFEDVEAYVNYTGLVPGKRQSANKSQSIGITKEGSSWLRWAYVEAAQAAPRQIGRLSRFYWKKLKGTGNRNKAIVATARETASIAYYVMKRQQGYYEPINIKNVNKKAA